MAVFGILLIILILDPATTINPDRYDRSLHKLQKTIENHLREKLSKNIKLQQDNVYPQISRKISSIIQFGWTLVHIS